MFHFYSYSSSESQFWQTYETVLPLIHPDWAHYLHEMHCTQSAPDVSSLYETPQIIQKYSSSALSLLSSNILFFAFSTCNVSFSFPFLAICSLPFPLPLPLPFPLSFSLPCFFSFHRLYFAVFFFLSFCYFLSLVVLVFPVCRWVWQIFWCDYDSIETDGQRRLST